MFSLASAVTALPLGESFTYSLTLHWVVVSNRVPKAKARAGNGRVGNNFMAERWAQKRVGKSGRPVWACLRESGVEGLANAVRRLFIQLTAVFRVVCIM